MLPAQTTVAQVDVLGLAVAQVDVLGVAASH